MGGGGTPGGAGKGGGGTATAGWDGGGGGGGGGKGGGMGKPGCGGGGGGGGGNGGKPGGGGRGRFGASTLGAATAPAPGVTTMGLGQSALVMGAEGISSSEISMSSPEDCWPWKRAVRVPQVHKHFLSTRKLETWDRSVLEIPSGRMGHVQTHQPAQILRSPLVQGASNSRQFNHHLFSTRVLGSVVDAENMNVTDRPQSCSVQSRTCKRGAEV